ncbi:helix-turn-helix transcriptional regulator [Paenibacillus sp. TRM 82003]|nr:helix-turn-helix transcriptional regulator [Paenibacillus sp. TRM 82003]MCI3923412.1 helix-turn-helix transcriptional regulator [Paenibacillus sp. TRM 82003]
MSVSRQLNDDVVHDLTELKLSSDFYSVFESKQRIIHSIKTKIDKHNITVRRLAEQSGMKHPQVIRVTSGENYNIETLIKILDALDLEIIIKEKAFDKLESPT